MADGLSEDPRAPLARPFETYRLEFLTWYQSVRKGALWTKAGEL